MKESTITKAKASTKPVKRIALGVGDYQTLKKLARDIRTTWEETEALVAKSQEHANAAVASAIACGRALNEAKAIVPHGEFEDWIEKHCKVGKPPRAISKTTAERYMRLSKASHVTDLNDVTSLRQAYIAVGIIPEISPAQRAEGAAQAVSQEDATPGQEMREELGAGVAVDVNGVPVGFQPITSHDPRIPAATSTLSAGPHEVGPLPAEYQPRVTVQEPIAPALDEGTQAGESEPRMEQSSHATPETTEPKPLVTSSNASYAVALLMIKRGVDDLLTRLGSLPAGEAREMAAKEVKRLEDWI